MESLKCSYQTALSKKSASIFHRPLTANYKLSNRTKSKSEQCISKRNSPLPVLPSEMKIVVRRLVSSYRISYNSNPFGESFKGPASRQENTSLHTEDNKPYANS